MSKVIGIDLGTGFSCVSVMEAGEPKVIFNSEGHATTPSVVSFSNGERKVGDSARRQAITNPTKTISSIKRFMGESYDNVIDEVNRAQYKVVKGSNGNPQVDIDGKLYTPQEISAVILQKMKKTAEDYLGEEVTDAVITCPAYYDDTARNAVKDAGKISGLNVLRVINEPTAAALAFGLDRADKDMKIMVTDIGCGTSDFTLLQLGDGIFEVIATDGDTHLGGDDFDNVIIDYLVDFFKQDHPEIDLKKDPMAMQRLKEAAEKTKIELSSTTQSEVNLPYISVSDGVPVHLMTTITRSKFEQLSDKLISRISRLCKSCSDKAGLKTSDIDEIILVGGSTRIPAIQDAVEKFFGKKPNKSVNPDEAVAVGAAIQGAILSGDKSIGDILLLDVIPLSLGIETNGGVFTKMVEANTTIPTKKTETFTTAVDNQPSVEIVIFQGERPMTQQNKLLGRFHLDGILPAQRGVPQIEVTFDIDANGILNVSAKDKATGKDNTIRIEASSGLSDAEIERMKKEAEENAEADKVEQEKVMTLNSADSALFQAEKNLKEYGEKLTDEQKTSIENAKSALQDAYDRKDVDSCKACMDILNKAWQEVATAMYSQAGGNQPGGDFGDLFNNFTNPKQS